MREDDMNMEYTIKTNSIGYSEVLKTEDMKKYDFAEYKKGSLLYEQKNTKAQMIDTIQREYSEDIARKVEKAFFERLTASTEAIDDSLLKHVLHPFDNTMEYKIETRHCDSRSALLIICETLTINNSVQEKMGYLLKNGDIVFQEYVMDFGFRTMDFIHDEHSFEKYPVDNSILEQRKE